jgi:hypothetical protein
MLDVELPTQTTAAGKTQSVRKEAVLLVVRFNVSSG